jgi:hypothetical protein
MPFSCQLASPFPVTCMHQVFGTKPSIPCGLLAMDEWFNVQGSRLWHLVNTCVLSLPALCCCLLQVTATAAATPPDNPEGGSSSRKALQVRAEGCPVTTQSVDTVNVVVAPPVGRSIPSVRWSAETQTGWDTTLKFTENKTLTYTVTWTKVEAVTSRLSGTVTVTNPTAAPMTIKSATVLPDFTSDGIEAGAAGGPQAIDLLCKDTSLAPRASVNCSYTATVAGGGPGSLVGQVQLSNGHVASSSAVSFNFPQRTSRAGSTAESGSTGGCADIVTGLFLSPALIANRSLQNTPQQIKACSSSSKQVAVTVGPFNEDACGAYTVSCDATFGS